MIEIQALCEGQRVLPRNRVVKVWRCNPSTEPLPQSRHAEWTLPDAMAAPKRAVAVLREAIGSMAGVHRNLIG
jgi:hypothetical protein